MFLEYLVTIMDDLEHPALIEELKQNFDADAYEEYINKDIKIPSIKKQIDHSDKN